MNPPGDLIGRQSEAELLTHNSLNGATGGIWRVNRDGRNTILKIAAPPGRNGVPAHWAASTDQGHWNYWQREALAYRDGLAETAYSAAGIRAPALLEWTDRPDGSVALWLEHVDGVPGTAATPAMLGDFAERLGAGHASWLSQRPTEPWLSRDWLRDYTTTRPVTEPIPWDHPTAASAWPHELRTSLRELWLGRYDVLRATDELPRTLCHHDVWPTNLIVDDSGPVLLDWSFVGPGPLGEDAANLILDTFFDGLVDLVLIDEVVEVVTAGYLRGLAGAVDAATVRRAIQLTGAAKYFWLAPLMLNRLITTPTDARQTYDLRNTVTMFTGRRRPLELVAAWFQKTR